MPAPEQTAETVIFPINGINLTTAASEQPPDTTPVGVNVRVNDVFASRERGGSRPGLVKLLADRPAGNHPTQMLNVVVFYDQAYTLAIPEQAGDFASPGGLVVDGSSSNFPNGPGPDGPGGGPLAPTSPPFPAGFNSRTPPIGRLRPKKGSGVQPHRQTGNVLPPPPPPPPGPFTRTYIPFTEFLGGEFLPEFSVGPFEPPLTPPTDLAPDVTIPGSDPCGTAMLDDLANWMGINLPTLAEINALVLSHGCTYGPPGEGGPYESISDS